MKKWFEFFCLSFFSHKISKAGAKRGYATVFLGLVLALIFLWVAFMGGDMLPFGAHYSDSPDFIEAVRAVLANTDVNKRIDVEIKGGSLELKKHGEEYFEGLLLNTFESDTDKQNYAVNGYNFIIDTRPADTLAEIDAYCVSNNGDGLMISYQEYLELSEAKKLQFDFKLNYTGKALELDDETVDGYRAYVYGLNDEGKTATEKLSSDLAEGKITKEEYNRAIYELYFVNYYPKIGEYEGTSSVPLLRNYYYHKYISQGVGNYLFIFDDYMVGSFETRKGIDVSFYGFYSNLENGALVKEGCTQDEANASVDSFIRDSFEAIWILNAYAYAVNIISLAPFMALMLMVATLLTYSVLKLRGVESIRGLGAMFKIIGSFAWTSGLISAVLTVIMAFFLERNVIAALPLILFFVTVVIRSMVFAIKENRSYIKQLEQEAEQTEV